MDRERLKELCEKATKGPWRVGHADFRCVRHKAPHPGPPACVYEFQGWLAEPDLWNHYVGTENPPAELIGSDDYGPVLKSAADADFIAAARQALPELLAETDALQAKLAAAEKALKELLAMMDDGQLVRNITNDHHFPSYLAESTRLVKAIQAAHDALATPDAKEG